MASVRKVLTQSRSNELFRPTAASVMLEVSVRIGLGASKDSKTHMESKVCPFQTLFIFPSITWLYRSTTSEGNSCPRGKGGRAPLETRGSSDPQRTGPVGAAGHYPQQAARVDTGWARRDCGILAGNVRSAASSSGWR